MKRRHLLPLLIVLAGIAISLTLLCPRQLPEEACSDIYRQYCHTPGIKAAYLDDFPLDDSTTIAVTMLQAHDSATWKRQLIEIYNIKDSNNYSPLKISFQILPPPKTAFQSDTKPPNDILVVTCKEDLTIAFFHLENEQQLDLILDEFFNKI